MSPLRLRPFRVHTAVVWWENARGTEEQTTEPWATMVAYRLNTTALIRGKQRYIVIHLIRLHLHLTPQFSKNKRANSGQKVGMAWRRMTSFCTCKGLSLTTMLSVTSHRFCGLYLHQTAAACTVISFSARRLQVSALFCSWSNQWFIVSRRPDARNCIGRLSSPMVVCGGNRRDNLLFSLVWTTVCLHLQEKEYLWK